MDTDVIVLCDLAELWNQAFEPGKVVMAKGGEQSWRFCVSMWDCAEAKKHLPPIEELRGKPEIHQQLKKYYKTHTEVIQP
ncbi:glycosyl transferase, partial [Escherichia coli]|nr:glycosyl transferase [Escherichia coli]